MLENLKSVASQNHQQTDPHKREVPKPCTASSTNSKRERAGWSQTFQPFSIPESEELDNQARKIECVTLVLVPEGTWRDMKKRFITSQGNIVGS